MDYQNFAFPVGMATTNFLNEDGLHMDGRPLTEAEKEEMIFRYKDAETAEEKERIKNSVSGQESADNIFEGPSIG